MVLPLLFWWRLWTPNTADRAVIIQGDFTAQYYPLQLFGAREIASGRLPTWNPYINVGQPGLADIQTGFFYPLNLILNSLLAYLGWPYSIGWLTSQVVLHFALASLFTYLFVRHLGLRTGARLPAARFAGVVAAIAFTYAGYLTSFPVQQVTILETAVWLPLVLLFVDRACHSPHPRPQIIFGALALACALLAGHPQTAMYVIYASLAYGLLLAHHSRLRFHRSRILFLLLILALGSTVAAVQLLPTLSFVSRSTRAGLDYEAVAWGFPLAEITHLVYPGYFGGSPQYVGILPPILAAAALLMKRVRRQVAFWATLGLLALLLSFGGHTFLYNVTYLLGPGFGAVRNQERIISLFSFAVSVLAGFGALSLVQPVSSRARIGYRRFGRGLGCLGVAFLALTALWYFGYLQGLQQAVEVNLFEGVLRHHTLLLFILGGSVLLFALRRTGKVRRWWLMALALGLIGLNLFTVNWRFNLAEPQAGGQYPQTGLVAFLKGQPETVRVSSAGLLPGGASAGIIYELEDITGNTPLRLETFRQFEEQVGSWRGWQLLNVGYVLSRRDLDGPGLERVYEEAEVKVYQVSDQLPRAWAVYSTVIAADDQAIDLLNAEDFDPRVLAILAPAAGVPGLPGGNGPGSVATVIDASPGRLILEVTGEFDAFLVVSQPFYPGWQARVDGQPVPIYRTDFLLQGLPVAAGSHRVELSYRPSLLPAIITLAGLGLCIAGLLVQRRHA
jgi:hypothetical protein